MNVRLFLIILLWPISVWGQGFAGLGTDADGFAVPQAGYVFDFPADHGPHPEYRIEWWYLTANLMGDDGQRYGVQWTLFRNALAPNEAQGFASPQIWMGHAALTSATDHFATERFARGGTGQAGASFTELNAWIDDWELSETTLTARGDTWSYDLAVQNQGPSVFHGYNGYSVKSEAGQASYYYSQPYLLVDGVLNFPDRQVSVTGSAWLDREWSSQPLAADQKGWDWFSLSFDNGEKLMAFRLRDADGSYFTSGTWIDTDGITTRLGNGEIDFAPLVLHEVEGRTLPVSWKLSLPLRNVDVTVEPLNADSWMSVTIPYWEGPIIFDGANTGHGYLEMTGY